MGDKERARLLAHGAGVPILQGSPRFLEGQLDGLEEAGAAVGYPLLVKAAAGGGGIGMRKVERPEQLREVVASTQTMARNAFGDGCVYLERYLNPARHIEIQVFGFGDGRAIHVFERECSIQRRFQKIVEESPAPRLSAATRNRMAEAAVALARQERYRGAGTIEFVVGPDEDFYFLEMNTRIQVEHPVSEMLTGLDLVGMQLRLARGDRDLAEQYPQAAVTASGHALECRLYAERPEMNFLPSPGPLTVFRLPPEGDGLRVDTGYREGDKVTHYYDPMLAKLVVHAADRTAALDRMAAALDAIQVEGIRTNAAFLGKLMRHPRFRAGESWTGFVETYLSDLK
jgi:3-methylcrotonyl-CoA carboxylase alpha subunit